MLASSKNGSNFAALKTKNGPLAQLNRAFDYGSKGYRFESCRDHLKDAQSLRNQSVAFLFCIVAGFFRGHVLADLSSDVDHSDKPGQIVNNFQKSSHHVVVIISC